MFLRRSCALFAENGLQAFVGVNNSGKSIWLRLFYELRAIFSAFSNQQAIYTTMLGNRHLPLVKDPGEIFCDRNGRDLVVGFETSGDPPQSAPLPSRFEIVMPRDTNAWCSRVYVGGEPVAAVNLSLADDGGGNMVVVRGASPKNPIVALRPISELGKALSRMLYLGAVSKCREHRWLRRLLRHSDRPAIHNELEYKKNTFDFVAAYVIPEEPGALSAAGEFEISRVQRGLALAAWRSGGLGGAD